MQSFKFQITHYKLTHAKTDRDKHEMYNIIIIPVTIIIKMTDNSELHNVKNLIGTNHITATKTREVATS